MTNIIRFYILSIIILLFFGINVLGSFGIHIESDFAPPWQKILPSAYLTFLIFICVLIKKGGFTNETEEEKWLLILFTLMCISLYFRDVRGYIGVINCYFFPICFSYLTYCILKKKPHITTRLERIIICFFIIECGLAILERIIGYNFFEFSISNDNAISANEINSSFRSTSLQNHPLQNALCVSIVMAYTLCSTYKLKYKLLLFSLGYIAILCFNTRSSIVIWGLLFTIYMLKSFPSFNIGEKILSILFFICGCYGVYYMIFTLGFGERLINYGLFDESSAGQRLLLLDIFKSYSIWDFTFGTDIKKLNNTLELLNIGIIENPWFAILFTHGLITLILIIVLFGKLFKRLFLHYTKFNKTFIILTFLLIASMNNSLVTPGAYLPLFILCAYIYSNKQILKS